MALTSYPVDEQGVALVRLEREQARNALNTEMLEQLLAHIGARIPVLMISGNAGPDDVRLGLSAGADVREELDDDGKVRRMELFARLYDELTGFPKPTIAVCHGSCVGGGAEVAVACDLRVAEKQAKLGFPETSIGVVPGWSGTQRAVRRFGAQAVRRMALGGEVFNASDALALGIVDRVVDTGTALAEANAWADRIAARGPLATEAAKLMIAVAEGEETASSTEALASGFIALTADLKAGVEAFRAKQSPEFSRR